MCQFAGQRGEARKRFIAIVQPKKANPKLPETAKSPQLPEIPVFKTKIHLDCERPCRVIEKGELFHSLYGFLRGPCFPATNDQIVNVCKVKSWS